MSFWRGVAIFGVAVSIVYLSLVGIYLYLESRPRVVADPIIEESPLEIMSEGWEIARTERSENPDVAAVRSMIARSFGSALDEFGGGIYPASFDHDELILSAQSACSGFDPQLDPSEWFKSERMELARDNGRAIRSLQMTVYFQHSYCDGIEGVPQDFSYQGFMARVEHIVENSEDEDSLRFAEIVAPTWGDLPVELSESAYSELKSLALGTNSPSVYLDSVSILLERPDISGIGAIAFGRLDNTVEARQAKIVSASLAQCEVFGVCPLMGLRVMSLCVPYDCPASGSIRDFYAAKFSDDVMEAADEVVAELVALRTSGG
jgi:hypothetical protein